MERHRLGIRLQTELPRQQLTQMLELEPRCQPITGIRVTSHQPPVRHLVERLRARVSAPTAPPDAAAGAVAHAIGHVARSPIPCTGRPEEGRQTERKPLRIGRVARHERIKGQSLVEGDVDHDLRVGCQRDPPAQQHKRLMVSQRLTRIGGRLVQIDRPAPGVEVRPQRLEHLVTVKIAPPGKREQLHEFGRPTRLPGTGKNRTASTIARNPPSSWSSRYRIGAIRALSPEYDSKATSTAHPSHITARLRSSKARVSREPDGALPGAVRIKKLTVHARAKGLRPSRCRRRGAPARPRRARRRPAGTRSRSRRRSRRR